MNRPRRRERFMLLVLVLALVLGACAGSDGGSDTTTEGETSTTAEGGTPTEDKVVYEIGAADDPGRRMMYYALLNDIVTSDTIELRFNFLPFAASAAAFGTRQYDIVEANWLNVLQAYEQGLVTTMISPNFVNYSQTIFAVPADSDIQSLEDLAGRSVGIVALGTAYSIEGRYVLDAAGIDASLEGGDIEWTPVESPAELLDLVRTGDIDAVLESLIRSWTIQENPQDYRVIENASERFHELLDISATTNVVMVTYTDPPSVAPEHMPEVMRMLSENSAYFAEHEDEIVQRVAEAQGQDLGYMQWVSETADFPTGPITEEWRKTIEAGWDAAIHLGMAESAPPWDEVAYTP